MFWNQINLIFVKLRNIIIKKVTMFFIWLYYHERNTTHLFIFHHLHFVVIIIVIMILFFSSKQDYFSFEDLINAVQAHAKKRVMLLLLNDSSWFTRRTKNANAFSCASAKTLQNAKSKLSFEKLKIKNAIASSKSMLFINKIWKFENWKFANLNTIMRSSKKKDLKIVAIIRNIEKNEAFYDRLINATRANMSTQFSSIFRRRWLTFNKSNLNSNFYR